jgi:hypothetical protein
LRANQLWWQLPKERQNVPALQLPTNDHLASSINAMRLKDRFGNVETDCRDRLYG